MKRQPHTLRKEVQWWLNAADILEHLAREHTPEGLASALTFYLKTPAAAKLYRIIRDRHAKKGV